MLESQKYHIIFKRKERMKPYFFLGLLLSISMLGAMESQDDQQEQLSQKLMKQLFDLTKTVNQMQNGDDETRIVEPLLRTYFPAYGRQKIAFPQVSPKPDCIFCYKLGMTQKEKSELEEDHVDKYPVVVEFDHGNVLFVNQMPYIDGHCLVIPKKHADQLRKLSRKEREEHHAVVDYAVPIFKKVFNVPGLNIGFNDGEWGGQSVPHAHTHIIPRMREGFTGTVAQTYVITKRVKDVHDLLKGPFSRLKEAVKEGDTSEIDIDDIIDPDGTE